VDSIVVNKADPVGKQLVESVEIRIEAQLPHTKTLPEAARVYELDAIMLESALHDALPGGTYDRLLALMLNRRASYLAITRGS